MKIRKIRLVILFLLMSLISILLLVNSLNKKPPRRLNLVPGVPLHYVMPTDAPPVLDYPNPFN